MAVRIAKPEVSYFPKRKPAKNASYLSWLHELPCVVTGRYGVEAAHVSFAVPEYGHYGRTKSHKASDRWALSLTPEEHHRQHRMGDERAYWRSVGVDPHIVCLVLWGLWTEMGDEATEAATAVIMQGNVGR